MTKGENKRFWVRKVRRLLNANLEFFTKVSGHKLNAMHYGCKPSKSSFRDDTKENKGDWRETGIPG